MAVLATCDIRRPELACENTSFYLLLLADCPVEEYHLKYTSAHLHKGGMDTVQGILIFLTRLTGLCLQLLQHRFVVWTTPDTTSLLLGTLTDLAKSKSQLVAENALLRQQLIILRRHVKRPVHVRRERILLVLLAGLLEPGNKPCSLSNSRRISRWHSQGFQLYWKYKSRAATPKPKVAAETVALIQEMAAQKRLWGALCQGSDDIYLDGVADGNVSVAARKCRVARRTIRDWEKGAQIPQLTSILQ